MQIDWFPENLISLPGRLGLTHLPGVDDSLDNDLESLRSVGVNRLLCLVEPHELKYLDSPETVSQRRDAVEQRGIVFMHHPIVDFDAPGIADAQRTVLAIDEALNAGEAVVTHCWAGLGRAGTMAACLLVHRGIGSTEAISAVRSVRNGAIQSDTQECFIAAFAKAVKRCC